MIDNKWHKSMHHYRTKNVLFEVNSTSTIYILASHLNNNDAQTIFMKTSIELSTLNLQLL